MAYAITWTTKALKGYSRLDAKAQARVVSDIEALSLNPRPFPHFKKLEPKSAGLYSLRVGIHYRAIYQIDDATQRVLILHVTTREGAY